MLRILIFLIEIRIIFIGANETIYWNESYYVELRYMVPFYYRHKSDTGTNDRILISLTH